MLSSKKLRLITLIFFHYLKIKVEKHILSEISRIIDKFEFIKDNASNDLTMLRKK